MMTMSLAEQLIEREMSRGSLSEVDLSSFTSQLKALEDKVGNLWASIKKIPGYGANPAAKKVVKHLIDAELSLESAKNSAK